MANGKLAYVNGEPISREAVQFEFDRLVKFYSSHGMGAEELKKNVEKLLEEAEMTMGDAAQIIVYLRDGSDYETVRSMFQEKYPNIPTVFTLAPVCRPAWLIEMECMAIRSTANSDYNDF